jgi:hypothetical protein
MSSQTELAVFWQRHEITEEMARLLESVSRKKWEDTSFTSVKELDFLKVSYYTHSQRYICDWENKCGVVLSLNRNENGEIITITLLLVHNYEHVEIPYELKEDPNSMGGYTNDHTTHLQRLE